MPGELARERREIGGVVLSNEAFLQRLLSIFGFEKCILCNDHQDFPKKRLDLFSYITDVIERLKKDSKRRTELMQILAGESYYNNILLFVWPKVKPIGGVPNNAPFFKRPKEYNLLK
jgi:hypothetical protein